MTKHLTPQETFDLIILCSGDFYPWVEDAEFNKAADAGLSGSVGEGWQVVYRLFNPDEPDSRQHRGTVVVDHLGVLEALAWLASSSPPEGVTRAAQRAARWALNYPDEADIDADAADQVVQVLGYGKVVYA